MTYSNEAVMAVTWAFTGLMLLILLLRLFTRFILVRNSGWEDYSIALSGCCCLVFSMAIVGQIENGLRQPNDTLTDYKRARFWQAFYGSTISYNVSLTCTKISLLLQYLRIFPATPWTVGFRRWCYIVLILVAGFGLWTCFGSIFQCWPISFMWDRTLKNGRCYNEMVVWFVNCGFNISSDLVIVILPLTQIRKLNLNRRDERLLFLVFGLAGLVVIASVMRQALVVMSKSFDIPRNNGSPATWSSIEINTGIICACLPPLRVLLTRILDLLFPGRKQRLHNENAMKLDFDASSRSSSPSDRTTVDYNTRGTQPSSSHSDSMQKVATVHTRAISTSTTHSHDLETGDVFAPQWLDRQRNVCIGRPLPATLEVRAPDIEFRRGSQTEWSPIDRRDGAT